MLNKQTYFKPRGFYQKKEEIMSGRGQGNKSRKRDFDRCPKDHISTSQNFQQRQFTQKIEG